jgi:hypothetical protein
MARAWKSRPASPPTSITECARRYHACAVALGQSLGLSLADTLATHRESVTAIYIETSRCDLRLPAGVTLPPLATPERPVLGDATAVQPLTGSHNGAPVANDATAVALSNGQVPMGTNSVPASPAGPGQAESTVGTSPLVTGAAPPLTSIPRDKGLPCGGQGIADLRPGQLSLLLGKVQRLAWEKGGTWGTLLEALQAERAARVERGRKKPLHQWVREGGEGPEGEPEPDRP